MEFLSPFFQLFLTASEAIIDIQKLNISDMYFDEFESIQYNKFYEDEGENEYGYIFSLH